MQWSYLGIVAEGQPVEVEGINIWALKWRRMDAEPLRVPHPSYSAQYHDLTPYELNIHGKHVFIAAGEVSANIYLFYVGGKRA